MNELLVTLKEIRAAADVIGDSGDPYVSVLNDIYYMADAAIVSAETEVKP